MPDETTDQTVKRVRNQKDTFVTTPPTGKATWLKRLGRKLTFWYVRPFGEAQNTFNEATADALQTLSTAVTGLQTQLHDTQAQTEERLSTLAQEQRQLLARAQAAQEAALSDWTGAVSDSLCALEPTCRPAVGESPLTNLAPLGAEALFHEIHAVQNALGEEETQAALHTLETQYTTLLQDRLRERESADDSRCIAIVCRSLAVGHGMDAIKNEAWDLYRLLHGASRYRTCLLSIEPDGQPAVQTGDVHCVPESALADWMHRVDPVLLVFCESTAEILTAGNRCMLMRNSVLRMSGQNPMQALGGSQMQELLHLCDFGVQRYCTASKAAADAMEELGFRRPAVIYPFINPEKELFCRKPRVFQPERFTVGFASSPMQEQQLASRGIPALCEAVLQAPELSFVVLWRDPNAVAIPAVLRDAPNCEIRTGKCDMAAFYSTVDCVLIPYADSNFNHACSLSALEGMLMGIPAVGTPVAGISELIAKTGLGCVSEDVSAPALVAALRQVRDTYAGYQAGWRTEKLRQLVAGRRFVRFAEFCASHPAPYGVITIYEWDRQLKLENHHLVKGHAALKAYYQRQDVAADYTKTRFVSYPQNCFDLMERQSVAVLLKHHFAQTHTETPALLDLACGDGRILQTLLPFGTCTAADASPAMLELVQKRFATDKLLTQKLDLLTDTPDGRFDAITIFRFIRHYEYATRRLLWRKLRAALTPNGLLLFDVPNLLFEVPHRQRAGWGKYNIYDVFWTKESLCEELAGNGLQVEALVPIGQGLYPMPTSYRAEPMTWTAAVRRVE